MCQAHQHLWFVKAVPIVMKEHQLNISAQLALTVQRGHGIQSNAMLVHTLRQVLLFVLIAQLATTVLQGQLHQRPANQECTHWVVLIGVSHAPLAISVIMRRLSRLFVRLAATVP